MNKHDIIQHLRCCATDSIWREEAEALVNAGVAVKMLHDIFENLEGQSMKGEMIAILNQMGHPPKNFARLDICSEAEAEQYIKDYNF